MEQLRICKKCLLREVDEASYFKDLQDYLDQLDEEDKVDNAIYENRLSVCKDCEYLNAGMCRACGCYVEMRAAMKVRKCPYKKW